MEPLDKEKEELEITKEVSEPSMKFEADEKIFSRIDDSLKDILKELRKNKTDEIKPIGDTPLPIKDSQDLKKIKEQLDKRFNILGNNIASLENDLSVLQGNLMSLEQNLSKTGLSNIRQKFDLLQDEVDSLKSSEPSDKIEELTKAIKEMQSRIVSLESSVNFTQMSEIINRLVFLESRIIALEGMIQNIPKYSPIVVE